MSFKADSFHHQHTVAEQALNPLLVQLLEKVAAVGGNWVHAPPSRRPRTKDADKQWSLMLWPDTKGHPNRLTDLCFTVMTSCATRTQKGKHYVRWHGAVHSAESSRVLNVQMTEWPVTYPCQEEDTTIINIYAPNIRAPQDVRQMLTRMKGEINNNTIIVGDFNNPLTPMDRSTK